MLERQVVSDLSDDEVTRLRRDRTGFVFQSFNLIPLLDVTENVALPFTIAGQDPSKEELRSRIRDAIALVDLTGKAHHKPDQLSVGEQQRVAVARALVTRPALLFADEPTGNLDYTSGIEILDALWRSCVERNQTIVLVTHDSKAAAYADRVLVVGDGRIRETIVWAGASSHDPSAPSSLGSPSSGCSAWTGSPGAASALAPGEPSSRSSGSPSASRCCSPASRRTSRSSRRSSAPCAISSAVRTCGSRRSARPG